MGCLIRDMECDVWTNYVELKNMDANSFLKKTYTFPLIVPRNKSSKISQKGLEMRIKNIENKRIKIVKENRIKNFLRLKIKSHRYLKRHKLHNNIL